MASNANFSRTRKIDRQNGKTNQIQNKLYHDSSDASEANSYLTQAFADVASTSSTSSSTPTLTFSSRSTSCTSLTSTDTFVINSTEPKPNKKSILKETRSDAAQGRKPMMPSSPDNIKTFYYDGHTSSPQTKTTVRHPSAKKPLISPFQFNRVSTKNENFKSSTNETPIYKFRKRAESLAPKQSEPITQNDSIASRSRDRQARKRSRTPKANERQRSLSPKRVYKTYRIPYEYILNSKLKRLHQNLNCKMNLNLLMICVLVVVFSVLLASQMLNKYSFTQLMIKSIQQRNLANRRIF